MEDIKEQLDLHDEMESENGQTLSFDLFLVDNPAPTIREYRIREEGAGKTLVKPCKQSKTQALCVCRVLFPWEGGSLWQTSS